MQSKLLNSGKKLLINENNLILESVQELTKEIDHPTYGKVKLIYSKNDDNGFIRAKYIDKGNEKILPKDMKHSDKIFVRKAVKDIQDGKETKGETKLGDVYLDGSGNKLRFIKRNGNGTMRYGTVPDGHQLDLSSRDAKLLVREVDKSTNAVSDDGTSKPKNSNTKPTIDKKVSESQLKIVNILSNDKNTTVDKMVSDHKLNKFSLGMILSSLKNKGIVNYDKTSGSVSLIDKNVVNNLELLDKVEKKPKVKVNDKGQKILSTAEKKRISEIDLDLESKQKTLNTLRDHYRKFYAGDRAEYDMKLKSNAINDLQREKYDITNPKKDITKKKIKIDDYFDLDSLGVTKSGNLVEGDWFFDGRQIQKCNGKERNTSRVKVRPIQNSGSYYDINPNTDVAKIKPFTKEDALKKSKSTREMIGRMSLLGYDDLTSLFPMKYDHNSNNYDVDISWETKFGEKCRLTATETGTYDNSRKDEDGRAYPYYDYVLTVNGKKITERIANAGYISDTEVGMGMMKKFYKDNN